MKYSIPCKHDTGEVREARVDGYYPLTREEIAELLTAASKSTDPIEGASIQVRLVQGIKGMKYPRQIDGPVAERENEMSELYVRLLQTNRQAMLRASTVEQFYQILNG